LPKPTQNFTINSPAVFFFFFNGTPVPGYYFN